MARWRAAFVNRFWCLLSWEGNVVPDGLSEWPTHVRGSHDSTRALDRHPHLGRIRCWLNLGQIFKGIDLLTPGICTALGAAAGTAVYAAKQSQSGDDSDADRVDATLLPFALEGNRSKFHACTQTG